MNIPPDVYANIVKQRPIKKISHNDAQGKAQPTQGRVINGPVNDPKPEGRAIDESEFMNIE